MIIVKLQGGLGNQMFEYALGRHLAIKNKTELKMDLSFLLDRTPRQHFTFRDYNLDILNIKEEFATNKDIKSIIGFLPMSFYGRVANKLSTKFGIRIASNGMILEQQRNFDPNILNLQGDLYLDGYWQTEKYFKDISDIIRKDFSFNISLEREAAYLVHDIKKSNSVFISFRRGDYVTDTVINKHHGVLDVDYYKRAISYITKRVENPKFFIFSDDIDWCINNFNIDFDHKFVTYGSKDGVKFANDIYLMSLCKHSIISNSSFAWWGAWLNNNINKIVIAPNKWIADKSEDVRDIVPELWVKL